MNKKFSITRKVTFTAIGAYTESFVSELIKSGVKTSGIKNKNGILYITIRRRDYKKAAYIARNNNVRIRTYKRHGINLYGLKRNRCAGVIIGVLFISVTLLLMQKFIWKIDVYGTDKLSESQILKTVAESGIKLGAYTENLDIDSAEYKTKLLLSDISWINIEANGSRIDIYLNEGEKIEKPEISVKTPCNVIAAKDGIIVDTEVYSGTLLYNKGSGVSEGTVIVRGVVNDGADNLIMTHANAKIIADFTETVTFREEFECVKKITKSNYITEKELMLFGFVIPITNKIQNSENKICEEITNNCYLFGYELPWKVKTYNYSDYEEIIVRYTVDDVNRLLEQQLEIYCNNFHSEYEILDINKKIEYDELGITLTAKINLRGNIAVQQEFMSKNY